MRINFLTKALGILALVAFVATASYISAQADDDEPEDTPDVTVTGDKEAKLSPREMTVMTEQVITEMKEMLRRVIKLQQAARKQKDVIKLNCVNDKLLQVKQLLNIAESASNDLVEAVAAENEGARYHQYSQITISHEKVTVLRDEAEACIGEELIFLGPTEVEVDAPPIVDDPTAEDPFNVDDMPADVDWPDMASPYL
jgi:hypothetical protein